MNEWLPNNSCEDIPSTMPIIILDLLPVHRDALPAIAYYVKLIGDRAVPVTPEFVCFSIYTCICAITLIFDMTIDNPYH
jgi:hypothetical protein